MSSTVKLPAGWRKLKGAEALYQHAEIGVIVLQILGRGWIVNAARTERSLSTVVDEDGETVPDFAAAERLGRVVGAPRAEDLFTPEQLDVLRPERLAPKMPNPFGGWEESKFFSRPGHSMSNHAPCGTLVAGIPEQLLARPCQTCLERAQEMDLRQRLQTLEMMF